MIRQMHRSMLFLFNQHMTGIKNASKRIILNVFPFFFGVSFFLRFSRRFMVTIIKSSKICLQDLFVMGSDCRMVLEKDASLIANGKVSFEDRCTIIIHSGGSLVLEGDNWFMSDCWIEVSEGQKIQIGSKTTFQKRCELHGSLQIGNDCVFAPDVFISSGGHTFEGDRELTIREQDRKFGTIHRQVKVGDSCWVGIRSWLSPGIVLADKSVIGANSVVTKDTNNFSVNAGVPSKEIRRF